MDPTDTSRPRGAILRSHARYYDLLVALFMFGSRRRYIARLLELSGVRPGAKVLDIGCGTGTLAIAARRLVGPQGAVQGIDASPEMLARAQGKARRAGVAITFVQASVERMPFDDASFDVVFSTLMLHHLPRPVRAQCAAETRRVLKPGGRALVVDFAATARERKGLFAHVHRHGQVPPQEITRLLADAGLQVTATGQVGVRDLHYTLATAPRAP